MVTALIRSWQGDDVVFGHDGAPLPAVPLAGVLLARRLAEFLEIAHLVTYISAGNHDVVAPPRVETMKRMCSAILAFSDRK